MEIAKPIKLDEMEVDFNDPENSVMLKKSKVSNVFGNINE